MSHIPQQISDSPHNSKNTEKVKWITNKSLTEIYTYLDFWIVCLKYACNKNSNSL
jgi:hypothetical protein